MRMRWAYRLAFMAHRLEMIPIRGQSRLASFWLNETNVGQDCFLYCGERLPSAKGQTGEWT